jgi:hypothetical protein
MTPPVFSEFVAVDWSGARGANYAGVAVATCRIGAAPPELVAPPARRWRRADFVEWVAGRAGAGERVLIGIDCAFALPAATAAGLLGPDYLARELWDLIDRTCADAVDFYGGDFADAAAHRALFWRAGKRPPEFAEHHRATEHACRVAGLGSPESPLKLVGARQVGKGGLAGMRVLATLKRRLSDRCGVWPFEGFCGAHIVLVEIYPRLFMRMAGHGNTKIRTGAELESCLGALGCAARARATVGMTDHEADALVSAAGLRVIAGDPGIWNPAGLDSLARRAEGWIFGVP